MFLAYLAVLGLQVLVLLLFSLYIIAQGCLLATEGLAYQPKEISHKFTLNDPMPSRINPVQVRIHL